MHRPIDPICDGHIPLYTHITTLEGTWIYTFLASGTGRDLSESTAYVHSVMGIYLQTNDSSDYPHIDVSFDEYTFVWNAKAIIIYPTITYILAIPVEFLETRTFGGPEPILIRAYHNGTFIIDDQIIEFRGEVNTP
jgi:hypothetical protein